MLLLGFLVSAGNAQAEEPQLPGFADWTGDFDGMQQRRLIRILVPYSKTIYFIDGGEQHGTAVDFGQALDDWLNKKAKKVTDRMRIAFVPVAREQLLPALVEGRGDIVMANLTVTPARNAIVDFTAPLASGVHETLVTGPASPLVDTIDDLGGQELFVRKSSSYYEHLLALNEQRRKEGKPEIVVREISENLEDEDLLEMVNAGLMPWCIVDRYNARTWAQVFDSIVIKDDISIATEGDVAWAIRKDSPKLKELLDGFIKQHKVGTTFGNMLKKRYYQSDKVVRAAYDEAEIAKFQALRLIFEKHAASYAFDTLMLIAQGYQESHLDQSERSPRGAVGIMQLLPSTAADKAVGITGIETSADRNVEAGAKYMRHLSTTYLDEPGLKPLDKMLLTFAAYNAGPGNLRKFRAAATKMGLDPNVWFGNVENGAARIVGRETVQYVGNIYKYYIAYTLFAEREAQHKQEAKQQAPQ